MLVHRLLGYGYEMTNLILVRVSTCEIVSYPCVWWFSTKLLGGSVRTYLFSVFPMPSVLILCGKQQRVRDYCGFPCLLSVDSKHGWVDMNTGKSNSEKSVPEIGHSGLLSVDCINNWWSPASLTSRLRRQQPSHFYSSESIDNNSYTRGRVHENAVMEQFVFISVDSTRALIICKVVEAMFPRRLY